MSKYTFLVFLLFALFLNSSFKIMKGCSGTYFIVGKAYNKKNTLIKKESIQVVFGDKKFDIKTNPNGEFELVIEWMNACKSVVTSEQHAALNKKFNPEKIVLSYENQTLTIENEWKKYGKCGVSDKKELTNKKDLHFN